jgi:mannose-6-phosphate isomerase-like protein (cupin superfamily)
MKNPSVINTYDLQPVANVCNQELREVISLARASVAHVIMQPQAISLSHKHQKMREIYYILSGKGIFYKDDVRLEVGK